MAKATYAALIAGCLFLLPGTTRAESLAPVNAPVSFSLAVVGSVSPHATYWVSYGPLNGRFGIRQLHRIGAGRYGVTLELSAGARGAFYYLTGHGSARTRLGIVPGEPVTTIKQVMLRPTLAVTPRRLSVSWHVPFG
jgi:Fe2+ transport system protein FeoA